MAPGTEQISQRVSYFNPSLTPSWIQKEEKWRFLKDALWGGGGVPTGAQGPWLQERVGGGRRDDGIQRRGRVAGKGWLGGWRGCKGFRCGGVDGAFCFLKDALWGGGGYPPELAWWTGG